jgi:hypothetical protein
MESTVKRKYFLAVAGVSALFLLNALGLWLGQRYDLDFQRDPIYPSYVRIRNLILQAGTIIAVFCALGIWSGLIYWRSRTNPLSDKQKLLYLCAVLSVIYGYVLTAYFKL